MNIYFDPLNPVCKNITGGIYRGEELILNLLLLNDSSENQSETANYFPKQNQYQPKLANDRIRKHFYC